MKNFINFKINESKKINIFTAIKRKDMKAIEANKDSVNTYKNSSWDYSDNVMISGEKMTTLVYAIKNSNAAVVKKLIELGADVNDTYSYHSNMNDSPLYVAVYSGKINIIKYLLDAGADVNFLNSDTETALDIACDYNNSSRSSIVSLLLNAGAKAHIENLNFILDTHLYGVSKSERKKKYKTMFYLLDSDNKLFDKFIEEVKNINDKDFSNELLNEISKHKFKYNKSIDTPDYNEDKELIEIKKKIENGASPTNFILSAVKSKNLKLSSYIIDAGADLFIKDSNDVELIRFTFNSDPESFKIFKKIIDKIKVEDINDDIIELTIDENVKYIKYIYKKIKKANINTNKFNISKNLLDLVEYSSIIPDKIIILIDLGVDMFKKEKWEGSDFYGLDFLEILQLKAKYSVSIKKKLNKIMKSMIKNGYYDIYLKNNASKKFNL
jgi:ankyrin repeat protein